MNSKPTRCYVAAGILLALPMLSTAMLSTTAAGSDLLRARHLLRSGKYDEAQEIYAALVPDMPKATIGIARCLRALGQYDEACRKLQQALKNTALEDIERSALLAEHARLCFERGEYTEARPSAKAALEVDGAQTLARWITAELDRVHGRLDEAEEGYAGLITYCNEHDVDDAESLRWIGMAAARYASWNRMPDQFQFLVNELYPTALKNEPDFWPAHYESGMLFLEKFNQADATKQLQAALVLNPNAAEVHVALARLAVMQRKIERAEASVTRALEINPALVDAWLVKADLAWANFKTHETLRLLEEETRPLCPTHEPTLGRIAACYLLIDRVGNKPRDESNGRDRFGRLVEEVTRRNEHAGEFYYRLGMQLLERHKFDDAQHYIEEATRRMPRLVGPRALLGMLRMRAAEKEEARRLLREAIKVDPFNMRVDNTLQLLDMMGEMEVFETEHFIITYDGKHDELFVRHAAQWLEAAHERLGQQYGYEPPKKTAVQIFRRSRGVNGQQWFSTRLVGMPYLGVVAASTGKMIGMVSPSDPAMAKKLNWARVLRHELVHVFTIQQTDFNIPHWYTEGLAVSENDAPRSPRWNELLRTRVPKGDLFNLDTLNFGFTRPNSSDDWQLAYCQAELYVDYMLDRWGPEKQNEMLAAYCEGLTTREVIDRVYGVSLPDFEKGYVKYLEEIVSKMPPPPVSSKRDIAELRAARRSRPDDAGLSAELAYQYLLRGANEEAFALAGQVIEKDGKQALAGYVMARLRLLDGRTREAVDLLEKCLDEGSPHLNTLNLLAALRLKAEQFDEAARLYALGQRADPIDLRWTKSLLRTHLLAGNETGTLKALTRLAAADIDDLTVRKKLAQMAIDRGEYTAAYRWASEAVEIDISDLESHRLFAEAAIRCHNYAKAIDEYATAIELVPGDPKLRYALAEAYLNADQVSKARETLEELLRRTPGFPGARLMLENLPEESD